MRIFQKTILFLSALLLLGIDSMIAQKCSIQPVTKNASPEARALLKFFYSISGEYLLTGQHNFPDFQTKNTQFAAKYIGRTPVIYSTDFGFARSGDKDSYLARQKMVVEVIRQNKLGSIITLCWHAVPPTAEEPVTFQPLPGGTDSTKLQSILGRLTQQQYEDILTPGTVLYKNWCRQVDTIAVYLKKLQQAHVPVIWRPYHEMNGDWFWWGGRVIQDKYSTVRLYRQMFDRLVNYHKLNNLIWLWNVDRPSTPSRKFSSFYVGKKYFDMASLDVYGSDFKQSYYDSLLALADGKPIVLGEVGNPPPPDVIKLQPKWSYYVTWAGMVRNTTKKQYQTLINDSHVLTLEDKAYRIAIEPYRKASGLPALPLEVKRKVDFSGYWKFDENSSALGKVGTGNIPYRLHVTENDHKLDVKRTIVSEYSGDNSIEDMIISLDGMETDQKTPFGNEPLKMSAYRSENGDTLYINSNVNFNLGGHNTEFATNQAWTLSEDGQILSIKQSGNSFQGKNVMTIVYRKE